jgi:hypothetical protein
MQVTSKQVDRLPYTYTVKNKRPLTSEEISAIVDGFEPIDVEEMEMMAKLPPGKR